MTKTIWQNDSGAELVKLKLKFIVSHGNRLGNFGPNMLPKPNQPDIVVVDSRITEKQISIYEGHGFVNMKDMDPRM